MKLITFLIPVYNEVKTIEKAILEVVNLKDVNKEIIIIDNNSTDGTKEIINKFSNFAYIKVIFKDKNLGYGDTIKKGISLAKGEYIYIQYADLEYHIDGFNLMFKEIKSKKSDVIFGERYKNKKFLEKIKFSFKRPSYLATLLTTGLINIFYERKYNDIIGSKLYYTKTVKKLNITSNKQGFDFEFVSKICKYNLNVDTILIPYKPRQNFNEKKIKFYHMFNALYEIFRIKFFK